MISDVLTLPNLLISEAHVLTDGLAGAESRMIGIIGLHHKAARERHFPLDLLEKGLKVKIEETLAVLTLFGEPFYAFGRSIELTRSMVHCSYCSICIVCMSPRTNGSF